MSVFQAAMPTGSYPSLMSGGVVAGQGSKSDDLDNFKGSAYYGKSYYWTGGQTPSNAPSGANGGLLLVQRCGVVTVAQIFMTHRSSNGTTPPVVYQRSQTSADTWSDWEEIVTSNGTYPNLGAGYLARQNYINSSKNKGWWKFAEYAIPSSLQKANRLTSAFILFNGINSSTGSASGTIEFDLYYNTYSGYVIHGIYINNGSIDPNNVCAIVESDKISLYANITATYYSYAFSIRSEWTQNGENNSGTSSEYISFTSSFYGTTAPEGAVYAVVRNIASYAESIPAASQTVLGGAKMYVDSDGYFCIDTQ